MGAPTAMGKRKAPSPKGKKASARTGYFQIRMSGEFREWLQKYADSRMLTATDTMIQAVIRDAKAEGFPDPPPKR